ncbi:MAG: ferritin family protein [bacterium]
MNPKSFELITFSLIVSIAVAVLILPGCTKGKEEKQPLYPASVKNLTVAYEAALKRASWCQQFAAHAEQEKKPAIAAMIKGIVRSEQIHATQLTALLESLGVHPEPPSISPVKVGTIQQCLKNAYNTEILERNSTKLNWIRQAKEEGFEKGIALFTQMLEVEKRHVELLQYPMEHDGQVSFAKNAVKVCPDCGYIITSGTTPECPVCKMKKDQFISI